MVTEHHIKPTRKENIVGNQTLDTPAQRGFEQKVTDHEVMSKRLWRLKRSNQGGEKHSRSKERARERG